MYLNPAENEALGDLREAREKFTILEKKIHKDARKKKREQKRSNLKRMMTGYTGAYTDGQTDYDTQSNTTTVEKRNQIEEVMGPWNDFIAKIDKPRDFDYHKSVILEHGEIDTVEAHLYCLTTIGIRDFDKSGGFEKLTVCMTDALDKFRKDWRTLDMDVIERLIRICLVRELQQIEERKDA